MTFTWAVPQTIAYMINTDKISSSLCVKSRTEPGVRFAWHVNSSDIVSDIKKNQYDYIFVQGVYKTDGRDSLEDIEVLRKMYGSVDTNRTKVFLYSEADTGEFEEFHKQVAKQFGMALIPVGKAWMIANQTHPEIPIFRPDRHCSLQGSFLTSALFYCFLTKGKYDNAKPRAFAGLQEILKETAGILSEIAWSLYRQQN
jgi:hypothetical protein